MRFKIFIAVMASAIVMSSCEGFTVSKKATAPSAITGFWKFDSFSLGSSQSFFDFFGFTQEEFNKHLDTTNIVAELKADTLIITVKNRLPDTVLYSLDNNKLRIRDIDGSALESFTFKQINDSRIYIKVDSISLGFRRVQ